jgi:hypothetical protein
MPKKLAVGDHVICHASDNDPQYEIKCDETDHIARREGWALKKASV